MGNATNTFEENLPSPLSTTLRIFSAIFVIVFFVFSGVVFFNSRTRDKSARQDYVDIEDGFTIDYPKDWHVEKSNTSSAKSDNKTIISFTNPVGDIDNNFLGSASITVSFDYAQAPLNLEVYKNVIKSDMAHTFDNFVVLKEEPVSINGLDGYMVSATDNGEKADSALAQKPFYRSLILITTEKKSNREFFIWATAFESSWNKYENLFKNCIESFKIPQ